jgi:hypothetical protein
VILQKDRRGTRMDAEVGRERCPYVA